MRAISLLAAAAMVAGLFLPWMGGFIPWDMLKNLEPSMETAQQFATTAQTEALVLLASIILAGLFLFLAIFNMPSRMLAIGGGGLGVGLIVYVLWRAREGSEQFAPGLAAARTGQDYLSLAQELLQFGAWAWGIGAVILLFCGLVGYRNE